MGGNAHIKGDTRHETNVSCTSFDFRVFAALFKSFGKQEWKS